MTITNPLDMWNILVNEISGSIFIFIMLSSAVIFYFAAKFRMPTMVTTMILILWFLVLGTAGIGNWFVIVMGMLIGVFAGWNFTKLFTR